MRSLKFKLIVLSLTAVLISFTAFQASRPNIVAHAQTKPAVLSTCSMDFNATVRQGPSANTALVGTLSFDLGSDGGVTGQLTEKDGTKVAIAGQVTGRAINIAFQLKPADMVKGDKGSYIFGSGVAFNPIAGKDCGGVMGGTFAGPEVGDFGDWGSYCITVLGIEVICAVSK